MVQNREFVGVIGWTLSPFSIIFVVFLRAELVAGSCATAGYESRQVRKEAAAVTETCAAGEPSYHLCP